MIRVLCRALFPLVLVVPASAQLLGTLGAANKIKEATPAPGARFGDVLAIDGDRIVVGGRGAWLFTRTGTVWDAGIDLSVESRTLAYGTAVALDDDRAVVTDMGDASLDLFAYAHVFERSGTDWNPVASVPELGFDYFAHFGHSVDLNGDTLVVGSFSFETAHVYVESAGTWIEEAFLQPNMPSPGARFASSLALRDDQCIVERPGISQGVLFDRVAGAWSESLQLGADGVPSSGTGPAFAGASSNSVVLNQDWIIVGAPRDGTMGSDAGALFCFERTGNTWNGPIKLFPSDPSAGDGFGYSLSIAGDRMVVGAVGVDDTEVEQGGAYLYDLVGTTWVEVQKIVAGDANPFQGFGDCVAITGDTLAIGAPFDSEGEPNSGAIYVVVMPPMTTVLEPSFCYGDGGDQAGCTACPCGNGAPIGNPTGCLNSAGGGARLAGSGNPQLANDTLVFELTGAVANTFGLLASADSLLPTTGACPPGSGIASPLLDGLRCVGGSLRRHGVAATDGQGVAAFGPGLVAGFSAGQTRHFQAFYRDVAHGECTAGQNTSNAWTIQFQP